MADPGPRPRPYLTLDVELLTLQRIDAGNTVQSISVTTDADGTLRIASRGRLPRGGLRQIRQLRNGLRQIVDLTGKDVMIEHAERQLARLRYRPSRRPRWSIRWWTLLRGLSTSR